LQVLRRIRKTVKSDYYLRHICSFAWNNPTHTARIIMKFSTCGFSEKPVEKVSFIKF